MIIYFLLPDEILPEIHNQVRLEELFSELTRASLRQNHFIILDRNACDWASENLQISSSTKAQLNHLRAKYTQRKSLITSSPCNLEITLGDRRPSRKNNETHKYEIGHTVLLDGNYLERPYLLVENAKNDGEFLDTAFISARAISPITHFNVEYCHGGGSSIDTEFDRLRNHRRIVTSFFDSDRNTPICGPSQMFRRVSELVNAENTIGVAKESAGKEVENYLPLSIIRNSKIRPEYIHYKYLEDIEKEDAEKAPNDKAWMYFDLKCGISDSYAQRKGLNEEKAGWINESLLAKTNQLAGFGDNILSSFLNSQHCLRDFRELIQTTDWRNSFSEPFLEIYWYLVSERKRSTR